MGAVEKFLSTHGVVPGKSKPDEGSGRRGRPSGRKPCYLGRRGTSRPEKARERGLGLTPKRKGTSSQEGSDLAEKSKEEGSYH